MSAFAAMGTLSAIPASPRNQPTAGGHLLFRVTLEPEAQQSG